MRNKLLFTLTVFLISTLLVLSQTLSETDVIETMNRAFTHNKAKRYQEALEDFLLVGDNTKFMRTENERQVFVCSQTMACMCYFKTERYMEGYLLGKSLIDTKLEDGEKKEVHHLYALNGCMYARDLLRVGNADYKAARQIMEEVLPYSNNEKVTDSLNRNIAIALYFEGANYELEQKYEFALPLLRKAAECFHRFGEYKNEIDAWQEIGNINSILFRINDAEEAYMNAKSVAITIGDNATHLKLLRFLGILYDTVGDNESKQKVENDIYALVITNSSPVGLFEYYNYKGYEEKNLNHLELAEQWYLKGESILPSLTDRESLYYDCFVNLRDLYMQMKQFDKALLYSNKCLDDAHSQYTKNDDVYYLPYQTLVEIYKQKGDSIRAYQYMDSLFMMNEVVHEPREIEILFNIRGRLHYHFGNYAQALADYKEADRILATKYDKNDPGRILLLSLMGGVNNKLNNYAECEHLYKEYSERIKTLKGENHIDYINAVCYLANAEGFAGHITEGCTHYEWAVNEVRQKVKDRMAYLSAEEREAFWLPISEMLTAMAPYAIEANLLNNKFTRTCYDALVLSKAFLLETERSLFDVLKKSNRDDVMELYESVAAMKSQIRILENDYVSNADTIMRLTDLVRLGERQLLTNSKEYGKIISFMDIDYASIKGHLKKGEILLDFTDYVSKSQGRKYAAFVIDKDQVNPELVPLFAESRFDSMQIPRPDLYYDVNSPFAEDLLDMLWRPFEKYVDPGATVYYVPSHILFQIALESLPMNDGTLLGDHYNFVRLSSARELDRMQENIILSNNSKGAVLYGGLKYDLTDEEMANEAKQYEVLPHLLTRGEIVRGDSVFKELKGTLKEIESIHACLKKRNVNVIPYTGIMGTEESFFSMNGKAPDVLHIATHGFYYNPDQALQYDFLKGYKDAMMLSGLVLSGGNAAWMGKQLPEGVLSGILTANNIAKMDLTGTQLVVLSACQTGQGKATSEGLYGLQRAFKKAGVQSMVMTLWSVSDEASRIFMERFYNNLTNPTYKWNWRKAFEDAKRFMRTETKYREPYYWAAFVMLD